MISERHGVSIGIERVGSELFIGLKVIGKLTHEDYQAFTPMLESALAAVDAPSIRMLVDLRDFGGWEPRAAWDDLKIGLKHGRDFNRIALYGDNNWQEMCARIASWFICGEIKSFASIEEAMDWLKQED
tara:strand:+ start:2340 stop:2726 length:387 start_codon:yes stop_codon:yes gene_type:complete